MKKQSSKDIEEKYDDFIDGLMSKSAKSHKSGLHQELLNKIPMSDVYTNSITIAVGKQRSGKTRQIIKQIIKISRMHENTHMLLYCNKTGGETDKTFESFKSLIEIPIEYVAQDHLEARLKELIEYKRMYEGIVKSGLTEVIVDDHVQEIVDNLHVEDFTRPYLHTLILLDDIANSPMIKKQTSELNSLMTQCAHISCSFFLAVQYWVGLTPAIKSQCAVVYLFGGFPKEQVRYIFRQAPMNDPFDVIWEKYKELKNRDFMCVDVIGGEYYIQLAKEEPKQEKVSKSTKTKVDKDIKQKPKKQRKKKDKEDPFENLDMEPADEDDSEEDDYDEDKPRRPVVNITGYLSKSLEKKLAQKNKSDNFSPYIGLTGGAYVPINKETHEEKPYVAPRMIPPPPPKPKVNEWNASWI